MLRFLALFMALGAMIVGPAQAQQAPFDLAGPGLRITVQHNGANLPIGQVPNLKEGDQLTIRADLPDDQSAHYLLIAAFLRGATNPPPKNWFFMAEPWKRKAKQNSLTITVPQGARQVLLFLAPETGGDFDTLVETVRGRPGAFVRASQDLNQASLDRSRLDAYLAGIRAQDPAHPEQLERASPLLARSLAMKFNQDCLQRVAELQAACLTQDREALVLADAHSGSITETLTGAPTDLALQIASTPQGGLGQYSPYIGAIRDLAKILGGFNTAQYQYIPALSIHRDATTALLLNAPPSFQNPKSVLVVALPAIEASHLPPMQAAGSSPAICAARPGLVLPVEGAPLIFSTRYAHSMSLGVKTKDGRSLNLPLTPRADRGGYMLSGDALRTQDYGDTIDATIHGYWGFEAFDGPRFVMQNTGGEDWKMADPQAPAIAGRDTPVRLKGGVPACVESVALAPADAPDRRKPLEWKIAGADSIETVLPFSGGDPSGSKIVVKQYGKADPASVTLVAPARPTAALLGKSVQLAPSSSAITLQPAAELLPQDGQLSFSIKAGTDARFTGQEVVEVSAANGMGTAKLTLDKGLRLENAQILQASLDPDKDLGSSAFGPLRFRMVQGGVAGDWQALATLVRLPQIQAVACADPSAPCKLSGGALYLVDSVADNEKFDRAVALPPGFTGTTLDVPHPVGGKLYIRLRDDPAAVNVLSVPAN